MFVKKTTIKQIISVLTVMNEEIHSLKDEIGRLKLQMSSWDAQQLWEGSARIDLAQKVNLCLARLDILEKKKAKKATIKTTTKTKRK